MEVSLSPLCPKLTSQVFGDRRTPLLYCRNFPCTDRLQMFSQHEWELLKNSCYAEQAERQEHAKTGPDTHLGIAHYLSLFSLVHFSSFPGPPSSAFFPYLGLAGISLLDIWYVGQFLGMLFLQTVVLFLSFLS